MIDIGSSRADPMLTHSANEHSHVLCDMCVCVCVCVCACVVCVGEGWREGGKERAGDRENIEMCTISLLVHV